MRAGNWKWVVVCGFLVACGGGGELNSTTVDPPGSGSPPAITTQRVFDQLSFTQPLALLQAPGDSNRWFVVERAGITRTTAVSKSDVEIPVWSERKVAAVVIRIALQHGEDNFLDSGVKGHTVISAKESGDVRDKR